MDDASEVCVNTKERSQASIIPLFRAAPTPRSLILQNTVDKLAETEAVLVEQASKKCKLAKNRHLVWKYLKARFPNATQDLPQGELLSSLPEKEFELLVKKAEFCQLISYAFMGGCFASLAAVFISPFVFGIYLGNLFGLWPGIISALLSGGISFGLGCLFIGLQRTFGMDIGNKN